jgi:methyl-accepting chemotaxis protein
MPEEQKHSRRIKVIDGRLQYRTIAVALSVVIAGFVLFAVVAGLYYGVLSAGAAGLNPQLLLVILPALLINDLAIMAVAIVVGIFMTHRIAGPVYRMEEDIDRALSGERMVRVRLRRRDALQDLAVKVNELLERIDDTRAG